MRVQMRDLEFTDIARPGLVFRRLIEVPDESRVIAHHGPLDIGAVLAKPQGDRGIPLGPAKPGKVHTVEIHDEPGGILRIAHAGDGEVSLPLGGVIDAMDQVHIPQGHILPDERIHTLDLGQAPGSDLPEFLHGGHQLDGRIRVNEWNIVVDGHRRQRGRHPDGWRDAKDLPIRHRWIGRVHGIDALGLLPQDRIALEGHAPDKSFAFAGIDGQAAGSRRGETLVAPRATIVEAVGVVPVQSSGPLARVVIVAPVAAKTLTAFLPVKQKSFGLFAATSFPPSTKTGTTPVAVRPLTRTVGNVPAPAGSRTIRPADVITIMCCVDVFGHQSHPAMMDGAPLTAVELYLDAPPSFSMVPFSYEIGRA